MQSNEDLHDLNLDVIVRPLHCVALPYSHQLTLSEIYVTSYIAYIYIVTYCA